MAFSRDDYELLERTVATDCLRELTGVVVAIDGLTVTLRYADGSVWACPAGELVVAK